MTQTICKNCGKVFDSPVGCPYCGAVATKTTPKVTKNSIRAQHKREQAAEIGTLGPVLLLLLGIPFLFAGIIPGLIIIGIAIIWSNGRESERKKLLDEAMEIDFEDAE